ncbi:hypothetical protein Prudu_008069, partial [Prunus dulcis]
SAANGVRRHGVDPNRSRNEEVMRSLSSPPSAFLSHPVLAGQRPLALQTVPPATTLGADLRDRSQMNHDTTANNPDPEPPLPWPESAGNSHGSRRFVRMQLELPVQISPPFLHQIDRAPGARQDFKRRPLRDRSHRGTRDPPPASHSFRTTKWKTLGMVKLQGRLCRIFGRSRKRI